LNSKIYNFIYNCLFPGYPIHDVHSKPKIFRREVFDSLKLTAKDWFLDAEMLIQCRRYGYRIKQFPTLFKPAAYRKSFVKFDTVFEFFVNLTRARYREFFVDVDSFKHKRNKMNKNLFFPEENEIKR